MRLHELAVWPLNSLDEQGTQINTLAERANMTKQAASQVVSELEKYGYVARQPDPSDGRAVLILFTERGQEFLRDAGALKQEIQEDYLNKLGPDGFAALETALKRLLTAAS